MEVTHGQAQNWCLDPYGSHEERWFSRGLPTALVRDQGVECQDPPPDSAFAHQYSVLAYVDPSAAEVSEHGSRVHLRVHRGVGRRRDVAGRQ
jgi:hypothetical protein